MSRWCWLLLALCAPLGAAEIHVAGAASLSDVLTAIAPAYQQHSGHRLVFNFAGSNTLGRQIERGAPADVFLSADEARMNQLQRLGLVDAATRVSFLSNTLVVVVPKRGGHAIRTPRDLEALSSLALAEPESVPAGIYAKSWLQKTGLWPRLASRIIPTENVRGALAAVAAGNADAAIVYATDARTSDTVRVALSVSRDEGPAISYPFAVMADAAQPAAARDFLQWLQSQPALEMFARHGFLIRARQ